MKKKRKEKEKENYFKIEKVNNPQKNLLNNKRNTKTKLLNTLDNYFSPKETYQEGNNSRK